jgi:hypothetical protein
MLLDGGNPKVAPAQLRKTLEGAGFRVAEENADIGVVVGGDGRFSRYGRTEDIPLLFVGTKSRSATGSKAFLAVTTFDHLPSVLRRIMKGKYRVERQRRLDVRLNDRSIGEVFTDVYLQRGAESTCIRYRLSVKGPRNFSEAAIGDGVVVSTRAGSTGYFSYPDRIAGNSVNPVARAEIPPRRVGVCHIAPTYTEREGSGAHPLRYTVPWGSIVTISLFREADARVYGTTDSRDGIRVSLADKVSVAPGNGFAQVIFPR